MATAKLFTPIRVGDVELANRIVIAPMCQYSAVDGRMTDWHVIHLGHLALSGAALLTMTLSFTAPTVRCTSTFASCETSRANGPAVVGEKPWAATETL